MCIKINAPSSSLQPGGPMTKKETAVVATAGVAIKSAPARRTRTKIRKPKFLSLRLELSPENTHQPPPPPEEMHLHQQQLNLFPLHPENLVEEKDTHEENMERFFSAADGASATLTGLLGAGGACFSSSSEEEEENNLNNPSSSSMNYGYDYEGGPEGELVRTAMRNKERDAGEGRWVSYSEVVERKVELEEVSSFCGGGLERRCKKETATTRGLSLKLDYEEIMNAWCDKGPVCIHLDPPQTVPDLHLQDDDFLPYANFNELRQGKDSSSNAALWRVPEMKCKVKEEAGDQEAKIMGQREASVQRYKEKRQNRLFSKTIRYEVRKLNAQKRPRIKGRFVKRS